MKLLLTVTIFLLSLMSHGYIPYIVGIFILVLYNFLKKNFILNKNILKVYGVLFSIYAISSLGFQLDFFNLTSSYSQEAFLNNYIFYLYVIFLSYLVFCLLSKDDISDLKFAFKYVLLIHILFFYYQWFNVYLTGEYLDLVHPFTGEESRYSNYYANRSVLFFLLYRPTGFYVEPSTYSAALVCLLLINYKINPENKWLLVISFLTLLLNFSTAGIIFFFLILMAYILKKNMNIKSLTVMLFLCLLIFSLFFESINFFILDFYNKFMATIDTRLNVFDGYLMHPITGYNIFGYGLFNISESAYTYILQHGGAVNDSGLLAYLYMKVGVIAFFIFFYLLLKARTLPEIAIITSIFLSKISFTTPLFVIALVLYLNSNSHLKLSYMQYINKYFLKRISQ